MEQAWKQNAKTWSKKLKVLILHVFDEFWEGVGLTTAPSREPEKATRAPRRALGTGMEAKCSNMEQKAKIIDFTMVF